LILFFSKTIDEKRLAYLKEYISVRLEATLIYKLRQYVVSL